MIRAAAVSFALALTSTSLISQSGPQKDTQIQKTATGNQDPHLTPLFTSRLPAGGCPVSMNAMHAPGGDRIEVNGVRRKGLSQRLHLTVTNPDSKHIVTANVTVRGFTARGRIVQAMYDEDSSDAAKTLDLRFPAQPGKEISADLEVPGLSAVTEIELNSVTFSDGFVWKLAAFTACRSWVDGLMLVGSQ
jgi:hypothetical protein